MTKISGAHTSIDQSNPHDPTSMRDLGLVLSIGHRGFRSRKLALEIARGDGSEA